jgi:hypothetical protein
MSMPNYLHVCDPSYVQYLANNTRIKRPRWFLFFDFMYTTTVGFLSGFASSLLRVVLGSVWSALRCTRLEEPLLPGAAAVLDSGWLMHGSLLRCRYAAGEPPMVRE